MSLTKLLEDELRGFDESLSYCFNIGVVPDDMTKERIKNFITSALKKAYLEGQKSKEKI